MRFLADVAILLATLVAATDASAQRPGRQHGESSRDESRKEAKAPPMPAFEPYSALERELPSLKVDMKLTAAQADAWNVFERDVRHAAELDRVRLRQQMALRDTANPPPPALTLASQWADLDRRKSEASADLVRHLTDLRGLLDDTQLRMLDRRVALSQSEPLGR